MTNNLNRRTFMKMAGAAGTVVGAGSLGCSMFSKKKKTGTKPPPNLEPEPDDPEPMLASVSGPPNYRKAKAIPTICFGCTTHCGVIGWVQSGRVRRISGNPLDPNSMGKICAKANGSIAYTYYPERLLYPLKRVGKRGSGQWKRITWDEALTTIAKKLKDLRDKGTPEQFVFHYGRDKSKGYTKRFTNAYGTPHRLNRRSICSSNRRVPLMSFYGREFEWETQDFENTKYIINFGANPMEAYQGGLYMMPRIQSARVDNGAKMVSFEVRPSATASVSEEYYPIYPGTDGAVAMAMVHVLISEQLYNKAFWARWVNGKITDIETLAAKWTPEVVEKISGVSAKDIRRIAREFAAAAPHCTTLSNRGSAKHYNGFQADRVIRLLDVLVGNVGKKGGFCLSSLRGWAGRYGQWGLPKLSQPSPKPPGPKPWLPGTREFEALPLEVKERVAKFPKKWQKKYFGELATPSEYPLSWHWYQMRVGQLVYAYIKAQRQKVGVYMSYTLGAAYSFPEADLARSVLKDEKLIPFHVAIDIGYGEQASLADIILPEATSLERWDAHSTNCYGLRPYTGLRQPLVEPLGEARSIQIILRDLARKIGGGMEQYFDFEDCEQFYKEWYKNLPMDWEEFKKRGIWTDPERPLDYELYEQKIPAKDLAGSTFNRKTGVIYKKDKKGKKQAIGVIQYDLNGNKQYLRGFPTPTRRIDVYDPIFQEAAKAVGVPLDDPVASPLPTWFPVPGHENLKDDQLVMVTFKWNVHTQGRTGHLKYQAEIVHSNPIWMNPKTGEQFGLKDGDEVEVTVFRPKGYTYRAGESAPVGTLRNRVKFIKGVHPKVLACSHHVGHWQHGTVGQSDPDAKTSASAGMSPDLADKDIKDNLWWSKAKGGVGGGVCANNVLPINPSPLVGGQNWFDNVCQIRKV